MAMRLQMLTRDKFVRTTTQSSVDILLIGLDRTAHLWGDVRRSPASHRDAQQLASSGRARCRT